MQSSKPKIRETLFGISIRKDSSQKKNHIVMMGSLWKNEISSAIFSTSTHLEDRSSLEPRVILKPRILFSIDPQKYINLFRNDQLRNSLQILLSEKFNESIQYEDYPHNKKVLTEVLGKLDELKPIYDDNSLQDYLKKEVVSNLDKRLHKVGIDSIEIFDYSFNIVLKVKIFKNYFSHFVKISVNYCTTEEEFIENAKESILDLIKNAKETFGASFR